MTCLRLPKANSVHEHLEKGLRLLAKLITKRVITEKALEEIESTEHESLPLSQCENFLQDGLKTQL